MGYNIIIAGQPIEKGMRAASIFSLIRSEVKNYPIGHKKNTHNKKADNMIINKSISADFS